MYVQDGWRLPVSDLYTLTESSNAGRAIYARKSLLSGQYLLATSAYSGDALSPTSHVILRPYRREVCAQCFAYDRGREWKIRLPAAGVAFCSESCLAEWSSDNGVAGIQAHEVVESFVKQQSKRHVRVRDERNNEGKGHDGFGRDEAEAGNFPTSWCKAAEMGNKIVDARTKERPSKADRHVLRIAMESPTDPDVLCYLLSGALSAFRRAVTEQRRSETRSSTQLWDQDTVAELLPALMALADDPTVYMTNSSLTDYISGYHVLLAILPTSLLPFVQPSLCHGLASRASHNAFSIRPAGTTDGEQSGEFLGWGVWPEASFFNHSCRPNVRKERRGRLWVFWIEENARSGGVGEGEELCITYLGGDEKDLNVHERRRKLHGEWGFWCCCQRCTEESKEFETSDNISALSNT